MKKRVTEKQLAANRQNAKLSTGPRTESGKAIARCNALMHGLTARLDEVVPRVDGLSSDDYRELLRELYEHFKPEGVAETQCVNEMAHAMLLQNRAKSFESARIAQAAAMENAPVGENPMLRTARSELNVLHAALAEIASGASMSSLTYHQVVPILSQLTHNPGLSAEANPEPDSTRIILDNPFVKRLRAVSKQTEAFIRQLVLRDEENVRNYYRSKSLLSEADMRLVIKGEDRAFKKMKRAQLRLEQLQRARFNAERNRDELPFSGMEAGKTTESEVM